MAGCPASRRRQGRLTTPCIRRMHCDYGCRFNPPLLSTSRAAGATTDGESSGSCVCTALRSVILVEVISPHDASIRMMRIVKEPVAQVIAASIAQELGYRLSRRFSHVLGEGEPGIPLLWLHSARLPMVTCGSSPHQSTARDGGSIVIGHTALGTGGVLRYGHGRDVRRQTKTICFDCPGIKTSGRMGPDPLCASADRR